VAYIRQIKEQPTDPIGGASGEKTFYDVQFLGKTSGPKFPYTVATNSWMSWIRSSRAQGS
jgi:hypothetical protein